MTCGSIDDVAVGGEGQVVRPQNAHNPWVFNVTTVQKLHLLAHFHMQQKITHTNGVGYIYNNTWCALSCYAKAGNLIFWCMSQNCGNNDNNFNLLPCEQTQIFITPVGGQIAWFY